MMNPLQASTHGDHQRAQESNLGQVPATQGEPSNKAKRSQAFATSRQPISRVRWHTLVAKTT